MEPKANQINCENTRGIIGYIDLDKMDERVWTNSMCNKIGRLSQGWKKHAGTDTIEYIFHKYKPKYIRAACVTSLCNIRYQKTDTRRTRLTAGGNLIYYPG